jgi:hypothetical protein
LPNSSLGYFVQEIFLKLIQHPLPWVFLATDGVYWLLTKVTPRDLKTRLSIPIPATDAKRWWQDHYVIVVIGVGLVMIAAAFHYYLIDIIRSVRLIVAQLVAFLSETQTPAPADIATPSQIGKPGDPTDIRDLSYAIAVLLGVLVAASTVPFALIRVWINDRTIKAAERTTNAAEQGLITDPINTAVTGLGVEKTVKPTAPNGKITENTDANIEVRLGAVYALERISQDSDRDHMQIMEILCVYIRTNAPWDMDTDVPWDPETSMSRKEPRADIQATLTVIGRRAPDKIALERHKGFVLDLRDADLRGTDLRDGDFAQAWFWRSNFQFAVLTRTNLKGADLRGANLSYARLIKTRFDAKTDLLKTTFDKAFVFDTDFSKTGVTQEQLSQMFASVDTRVPPGLTRPTHWSDKTLPRDEFFNAYKAQRVDQPPAPPPKTPDA